MRPRQLKSCVPVFVYGGDWGWGWGLELCPFLAISDMSCLCFANLPSAGNRAKLTAGQRLEWLYQSPQVGSLKPTQTYNLSRLTLLSSQNNRELQWLALLPEQWWRGPSDGGSFRGYGLGSSKKACSQAHCLWRVSACAQTFRNSKEMFSEARGKGLLWSKGDLELLLPMPTPPRLCARQAYLPHGQGSEGIMKRQWPANQSRCL